MINRKHPGINNRNKSIQPINTENETVWQREITIDTHWGKYNDAGF